MQKDKKNKGYKEKNWDCNLSKKPHLKLRKETQNEKLKLENPKQNFGKRLKINFCMFLRLEFCCECH